MSPMQEFLHQAQGALIGANIALALHSLKHNAPTGILLLNAATAGYLLASF